MEHSNEKMNIENLNKKIENQQKVIAGLTNENEELYHQYNHLIIRNGKMLKRIDDFQKIIDDLHIRIEELQLINGNMMQINDRLRTRGNHAFSQEINSHHSKAPAQRINEHVQAHFNLGDLYDRWKSYPGQAAQNGPNLKKQVLMLVHLYSANSLVATELFNRAGVGGVTGARYVSILKKFDLICFTGARKKGHYEITRKGIDFIEKSIPPDNKPKSRESIISQSEEAGKISAENENRILSSILHQHNS